MQVQAAVVAAISALVYFASLGKAALLDWDEAIYAEISRQILLRHHWLTLFWQHRPFFEKPPLSLWIRSVFFWCLGISEFSARLESALAGVAILLLVCAISRRLWGIRTAYIAALVLLTMRHFDDVMRQASCDAPLCLCIYLALYGYLRLRDGSRAGWYVLCAAIGLGAMVKGPAIAVAPAAILLDHLLDGQNRKRWIGWREGAGGGFLLLLIAAPWHLWMWLHYGSAFVSEYAGRQVITRTFQPLQGNTGGPLFYLAVLAHGAFPWSLLIPIAAWWWLRTRDRRSRLPWLLALITLLLYTFVRTKIPAYIVPAYPALAMLLGELLERVSRPRRLLRYAIVALLAAGTVTAFVKFLTFPGFPVVNDMAYAARAAGMMPSEAGPLFVLERSGGDDGLDTPAAIFYSGRSAELLDLPANAARLSEFLQRSPTADAIFPAAMQEELQRHYHLQARAAHGELVYAVLSPR